MGWSAIILSALPLYSCCCLLCLTDWCSRRCRGWKSTGRHCANWRCFYEVLPRPQFVSLDCVSNASCLHYDDDIPIGRRDSDLPGMRDNSPGLLEISGGCGSYDCRPENSGVADAVERCDSHHGRRTRPRPCRCRPGIRSLRGQPCSVDSCWATLKRVALESRRSRAFVVALAGYRCSES